MPRHVIKDSLIKFIIWIKNSKWLELNILINFNELGTQFSIVFYNEEKIYKAIRKKT